MIKLYRYFKSHPLIFWLSMLLSTAFFVYFGLKVTYEEDITKLLPSSGSSEAMGLAFSDLKVKDKIFVQFVNPDNVLDGAARTNTLPQQAEACDYFMDVLMRADSTEHDIDNDMLYKIQKPDAGELMDPLIFLTEHVPSFVDESMYAGMDTIFSAERLNEQMIQNATGDDETLAEMDPFGMRGLLMGSFQGLNGGFSMYEDEADGQDPEAETVHLMTTDSTEILAFLSPSFKSLDSGTGTRLVRKLDLAVDSVRARYPMVDVYYHGAPINSVGNSQRIKLDLLFTLGLSILIIGILIMLSFRNHGTLPLLVLPIVYGAFFALTVIYFVQGSMSLMALGLGAIVLGVALSYCLHVLTHYKYVSDPEQVLREQVKPVLMGSLTTIGAFAGLLLTQSALLRDFGLFALLSVAGTTFACLAFMPQFFRPANNRRSERAFRFMERINNYPIERQNRLIILLLVLTVITCAFSFNVGFDEDLKHIGYFTDRIAKAQQLYAQKTTEGRKSQFYAVQASTLDEALHYNVGFHEACDGLVKSGYIHSYARLTGKLLVDSATQEARISAWKRYFDDNYDIFTQRIRQAALSAGLDPDYYVERLDELAAGDYETADVYAQIVDWGLLPSGLLTNFVEQVGDKYLVFTSTQMPLENLKTVNDNLAAKDHAIVVDPFYYTGNMVDLLHDDFSRVLNISMLFVFIVLLLSFRNVFVSIIAFLPMTLSWYVVQGIMAIFGIDFNLINIVISTFIFGIGVDYSIFVMDGMLAGVKSGDTQRLLYHKTAILLSAFVLIVCMGSLIFAVHPALSSVGVPALTGMISTILLTYTLEPFLFNLLIQTRFGKRVIERTKE